MKAMPAALAALVWIGTAGRVSAATCDSLGAFPLSNGKVTAATLVAPGAFVPPGQGGPGNPAFKTLPEFCRITASLTPTADSDIRIEVWLPAAGWNGKFQAVGNGGWAGVIPYPARAAALGAGCATTATDTGHVGNTAAFVPGHLEKLVDYGYRAVHEMTVAAKAIIGAYHGNGPRVSYWNGCSTGGRQGLMEAMRYPAVHADERSYIPPAKYPAIHAAALNACDDRDGVADGLIENPLTCSFDPGVLTCKHGDAASCLTSPQVQAARTISWWHP